MPEYRFKLTGWPAAIVAVLVLGVSAYQYASRLQGVDDSQRELLKDWLSKDYQGLGPRDLAKMVLDYREGRAVQPPPEQRPMDIGFVSLSAHGSRANVVVKARISVDGAPPTKGSEVRYFLLSRHADGWSVLGETRALFYYRALLPASRLRYENAVIQSR